MKNINCHVSSIDLRIIYSIYTILTLRLVPCSTKLRPQASIFTEFNSKILRVANLFYRFIYLFIFNNPTGPTPPHPTLLFPLKKLVLNPQRQKTERIRKSWYRIWKQRWKQRKQRKLLKGKQSRGTNLRMGVSFLQRDVRWSRWCGTVSLSWLRHLRSCHSATRATL